MHIWKNILGATILIAAQAAIAATPAHGTASPGGEPLSYPSAARGNQVDDYHGTKVADPYRWLEDIDSPATRTWVEAEAKLTDDYLAAIPGRDAIAQRLKKIWNYERWSAPFHRGNYWFFTRNNGLQNQAVLLVTRDLDKKPRVLIDPNKLSKDGTVALQEIAVSDDGKLLAYALSDAGSDWMTWRVRDVATAKDLPDAIQWGKFSGASWRKDGSGFYYSGYDAPADPHIFKTANERHKLFFHKLGTPQSQDMLVYTRADDPGWYVGGQVTDDGHYLIVSASHGTEEKNTVLVQDLSVPDSAIVPVIPNATARYDVLGNVGSVLYVRTNDNAPRNRIVVIDLTKPDAADWRTVVPEGDDTLVAANVVGGQIVAEYLHDAHSVVRRHGFDGALLGELALPGIGTAAGFAGRNEDTVTYYRYSSFTTPPSIYRLDLATGASSLWRMPKLAGFKPAEFETRQVFYASKDGTRVPMFITARKGVRLDGSNPTILYGYGGFNISMQPEFSPKIAAWLEMGGVFAIANLRGGGEYGRAWHEAGMKLTKQNVFDDFIAAAEYLIAQKWTNPSRLAIRGGSNGGLLVGAVEAMRPDLFAAAVAEVGVMDMLRFREFTVGKAWESDYGSVDNPAEFKAMLAYSPYHNVKSGAHYPATLILTGDHDDRVFPAHSFKFAAAMQHDQPTGKPILIRIETRAGHGQGKPLAKQVQEAADMYAFILHSFGTAQ
jgi:prolyl oligopeptidase